VNGLRMVVVAWLLLRSFTKGFRHDDVVCVRVRTRRRCPRTHARTHARTWMDELQACVITPVIHWSTKQKDGPRCLPLTSCHSLFTAFLPPRAHSQAQAESPANLNKLSEIEQSFPIGSIAIQRCGAHPLSAGASAPSYSPTRLRYHPLSAGASTSTCTIHSH
jgi:hypothetical protein